MSPVYLDNMSSQYVSNTSSLDYSVLHYVTNTSSLSILLHYVTNTSSLDYSVLHYVTNTSSLDYSVLLHTIFSDIFNLTNLCRVHTEVRVGDLFPLYTQCLK